MYLLRIKHLLYTLSIGFCLNSQTSIALEFHPGVGISARYTDNAELASEDAISDIITTASVRATLVEDEGPLVYDTSVSLSKVRYLNDTFETKRYFGMGVSANWELLRDRLDLYLTDRFSQRSINSLDADTPDNRQDSNAFILGANIKLPVNASQAFSLTPEYSQYYYENANTNNKQYSLVARYDYKIYRHTNVGLNLGTRKIEYFDRAIADTMFTNFGFIITGQRAHSNYFINLGATNVKKETTEDAGGSKDSSEGAGFSGSVKWQLDLSSRSAIDALVLTELTDTSRVTTIASPGNPNDVQLATDVIRNSVVGLTYTREDEQLHTSIWAEYRKLKYRQSTDFNSLIQAVGVVIDFPVTQLVSSGIFVSFDDTNREEIFRVDKRFNVGVKINVIYTNNLNGSFNVNYRTKESTDSLANYDEFGVSASLDYNF